MTMRELVLNHASVYAPNASRDDVVDWLAGLARGMAHLIRSGVAQTGLRLSEDSYSVRCQDGYSLFDAYQDLRRSGGRDQYQFLLGMTSRTPLLSGVGTSAEERFLGCEGISPVASKDCEPLVLCAITGAIAVSFPSLAHWDQPDLTVDFRELLSDGTFDDDASERVDNVAREGHADAIQIRDRARSLEDVDPARLWRERELLLPNLMLGPDVEADLGRQASLFRTILGKLLDLDASAHDWKDQGGHSPPWRTKVSPESPSTVNDRKLSEARRFRSCRGTRELFEWHARYGDGGRIQIRFESETYQVEVGYIGPHLPL